MSAKIIQFVPRGNPNAMILDRIVGIPGARGTLETNADPQNPNIDTAPSEYCAPDKDSA